MGVHGEMKNVLYIKFWLESLMGRPKHWSEDNIKMDLREIRFRDVD
jgi:hypothetical protein